MPPAKFKTKKKRDRKAEALSRLKDYWMEDHENEEWEPESEPIVTPMFRSVDGGIPRVIEALRAHDDDDSQRFIECLDHMAASDRKVAPLEAIAHAAGIGSLRLAEVAQTALFLYGSAQAKFLVSSSMLKVAKSVVKAATDQVPIVALDPETFENKVVGHTNGDVKAMELFGKMSGMTPTPKGAQIFIPIQVNTDKDDDRPSQQIPTWRSSGERLKEFHDLTEPKRLPSPASPPVNLGGHIDNLQDETIHILRGD